MYHLKCIGFGWEDLDSHPVPCTYSVIEASAFVSLVVLLPMCTEMF